ncbi:MAG: glutamine synthetase family protein, partial [Candidatus Hodarchaeales archaeon]
MISLYNMLEIRFVDIHGKLKAVNVPVSIHDTQTAQSDPIFVEGANIDGSSIAGFSPIESSDLHLVPDPSSLIELSYTEEPKLAVMCEIFQYGESFKGDTRSRLKMIIDKELTNRGWVLNVGPEPEFFLLKDNLPVDEGDYSDVFPDALAEGVIKRFPSHLEKSGIISKVHHHEVGSGQYEIEIIHSDALKTADAIVTYKAIVRALAAKIGYSATFMPKPFGEMNGNGMHFHLSLWEGESNLFSSGKVNETSELGNQFMAGILDHASALTVIVAPTVNSYKRLIPGYEAPVYIAWAPLNRSALCRIPMFQNPKHSRFEYRCPDPSTNPYLALTALIAAGMDGIKRELELPAPVTKNIFKLSLKEREKLEIKTLPGNLFEALKYLEKDRVLQEALGKHIYSHFMQLKMNEWMEYSTKVTDWDWK